MTRRYPVVLLCGLFLGSSAPAFAQSVLDRVIGQAPWNQPLTLTQLNGQNVGLLALVARVPIGIESHRLLFKANWSIPATGRTLREGVTTWNPPMIRETILTGMRLADALAILAAIDSRYEWREMDGVIVFRPVPAWRDALNPLFLPVPEVQLRRVTLSTVMGVIASALKGPEHASNTIVDTRRMSIDIPAGSVLDLLNAAAKAHGQLTWQFDEMSAADRRLAGARRHLIRVWISGSGAFGLMVP